MKVFNIQQIIFSFQYPFFFLDPLAARTVPVATGVVVDFDVSTGGTGGHMTAQYMGAALTDVADEFSLFKAQDTMLAIFIGKAVEHFCHGSHGYFSQASNGLKALAKGTSLTCR